MIVCSRREHLIGIAHDLERVGPPAAVQHRLHGRSHLRLYAENHRVGPFYRASSRTPYFWETKQKLLRSYIVRHHVETDAIAIRPLSAFRRRADIPNSCDYLGAFKYLQILRIV